MSSRQGRDHPTDFDMVAFQKRIAQRWLELGYPQALEILKLLEVIPSREIADSDPMADFADVVALLALTPEGITVGRWRFKFSLEDSDVVSGEA